MPSMSNAMLSFTASAVCGASGLEGGGCGHLGASGALPVRNGASHNGKVKGNDEISA